jgi:ClpP class serine protease
VVLRIDSPGGSVMASKSSVANRRLQAGETGVSQQHRRLRWLLLLADADETPIRPPSLVDRGVRHRQCLKTLGKLGINTDGLGTTLIAGSLRSDRALNDTAKQVYRCRSSMNTRSLSIVWRRRAISPSRPSIISHRAGAASDAKARLVDQPVCLKMP